MTSPPAIRRQDTATKLDLYSKGTLNKLCNRLGVKLKSMTNPNYVPALTELIGTSRHHELLDQHLTDDQWYLLSRLPLRAGPFHLTLFFAMLQERGVPLPDAFDVIIPLLEYGCLLPVTGANGNQRLSLEKQALWQYGMGAWFELAPGVAAWAEEREGTSQIPKPVDAPVAIFGSAVADLQRAAFVLLGEVNRKPVRITTMGVPYKADLTRLGEAYFGKAERGKRRQTVDGASGVLLFFALAVLIGGDLIEVRDNTLVVSNAGTSFFTLPIEEQARKFVNGWVNSPYDDFAHIATLGRDRYRSADSVPWFEDIDPAGAPKAMGQQSRLMVVTAIKQVLAKEPGRWYSIDDLASYLFHQYPEFLFSRFDPYRLYYLLFPQPYYPPQARRTYPSVYRKAAGASTDAAVLHDRLLYQDTDWMEVEGAYVREVLGQSLRWLGFTEVGGDPEKSEVFRLTSIGQYLFLGVPLPSVAPAQQGRAAIVQPNFEIVIVDATANLRLVAQLDIFAERRNLDRAATYQLTQAAIVRGLDQGWTGQRAIETLETANGGPLPQNVRYSLDQWVRLYEQLTLYEGVTLLEADGQRQLDRWLDNTKLAPLLGKQLGPTAVLLPAANAERVLKRLDLMSDTAAAFDYAAAPANVLRLREPDQIELLAGRDDPYLRYRLEALGERVEENRQSIIYRMTAQQLRASGEQGWNGQRLLGFLQTAAGGEVPEEFRLRLLGWSGAVPPLPAEALVAVSIPTTAVSWPELRQIPAIGRLLRAVLSDQVALIAGADREALRKVLAERGLQVQDGRLAEAVLAPAKPEADLKALIKQHRGDPESVYEALKSAGLIAKLDHIRWRSR